MARLICLPQVWRKRERERARKIESYKGIYHSYSFQRERVRSISSSIPTSLKEEEEKEEGKEKDLFV